MKRYYIALLTLKEVSKAHNLSVRMLLQTGQIRSIID